MSNLENNQLWLAALERERFLLAGNLHEGLCQNLCGILMQIRLMERKLGRGGAEWGAAWLELEKSLGETIDQSRKLSQELNPAVVNEASLARGLAEMAQSNPDKVTCENLIGEPSIQLNAQQGLGLFRIAQEALRDGLGQDADQIVIRFHTNAGEAELSISDNRAPTLEWDSVALLIMKAHADGVGARFKVCQTKSAYTISAALSQ